jgi:hypothetical protein
LFETDHQLSLSSITARTDKVSLSVVWHRFPAPLPLPHSPMPGNVRYRLVELGQLSAYGACLRSSTGSAGLIWLKPPTRRCWRPRDMIDIADPFATPSIPVLFSERIFTKRRKP